MSQQDLVEDFSLKPVPDGETLPGFKIAIVILAIGFTLPLFALGAQITQAQGIARGAAACFLGCSLVAALSLATSVLGGRLRLSTYVLLTLTFGRAGGRFINLILAVTLLGWFANVGDMLGTSVSETLRSFYHVSVPPFACTAIGLVLMTLTAIFGFRMMERFASVMVPLLSLFMIYVVMLSIERGGASTALEHRGDGSLSFVDAVSAVVGSVILTAVLAPDFTRYARSDRAAIFSIAGLAIGYPLIMLIAAVPAAILGQSDIMKIMISLGVPGLAIVMLVLATWTSNTGNLYSSTLTLATVFPSKPTWQLGVGGAAIALVAAFFHISDYFVPFLIVLGMAAIPIAGVYVPDRWFFGPRHPEVTDVRQLAKIRPRNTIAWVGGTVIGYVSFATGGLITPIPAVDALGATVLLWILAHPAALTSACRPRTASVQHAESDSLRDDGS